MDGACLQDDLVARAGLVQCSLEIGAGHGLDRLADHRRCRQIGLKELPGELGRPRRLRTGR
jgi:hypothetical protein